MPRLEIRSFLVTVRGWLVAGIGLGVGLGALTAARNGFDSAADALRLHAALAAVYGVVLGGAGIFAGVVAALLARRIRHPGPAAFASAAATTLFAWSARAFEFDLAYPARYPFVHGFGGMLAVALAFATLSGLASTLAGVALFRLARRARGLTWRHAAGAIVMAAALSALASARPRRSAEPVEAASADPPLKANGARVLVVGCDGADPDVVDALLAEGELPALRGLIERGVRAPLRTIRGRPSPALWTSVASSRAPRETGVTDFYVQKVLGARTPVAEFPRHFGLNGGLLLPDILGRRAVQVIDVSSGMVRVRRLWSILADAGVRVGVVQWLVTWPASADGAVFLVSDRAWSERAPARGGPREPGDAGAAPAPLWDPPAVAPELPTSAEDLRTEDAFVAAAALRLLAEHAPQVLLVYFRDVDAAEHLAWDRWEPRYFRGRAGAPPHAGPVRDAYVAFDRHLGDLLEAAGPDANVLLLSDHGHHAWFTWFGRGTPGGHTDSPDGVLVAAGPAFRRPHGPFAPSLYDVAPTVLRVVGLPAAEDMRGRALREILVDAAPLRGVATYEVAPPRPKGGVEHEMDEATRERLRALGYVH
jgi:hypothetical protein